MMNITDIQNGGSPIRIWWDSTRRVWQVSINGEIVASLTQLEHLRALVTAILS